MSVWGELPSDLDETCGNSVYKPPEASYTAQGPQKQPEILKVKHLLLFSIKIKKIIIKKLYKNIKSYKKL